MLKIYNTLTRTIEEFKAINPPNVGMYSCGPTVYDYQHIGHMRRYVGDDILIRVLQWNGFTVKHVMNITDVGHLTSDSDSGEDKMEKGAKKFGLSVWDIARKFEKQFFDSTDALKIIRPDVLMHATDYIDEQIDLVQVLEQKGYTYIIENDGVYFDTSKFKEYFTLSRQNPEELKKGARVEFIEGKKNPADFALWKFSPQSIYPPGRWQAESHDSFKVAKSKRQMEWDSPWGVGFPGWHIECSAMSLYELTDFFGKHSAAIGEQSRTIDIHTGGIDHITIHHTNEIAQAECATEEKFVNYWVHHNFLVVENEKMSKSLGNFYTVSDVEAKGFDPLALRYLYLQTHYRQEMNFTWEALEAAQTAYNRLVGEISNIKYQISNTTNARMDAQMEQKLEEEFIDALNNDLNTSEALAVLWKTVNSELPAQEKITAISVMDNLLGLGILEKELEEENVIVPEEVQELVEARESFRKAGDFAAADEMRNKIQDLGFRLKDTKEGIVVTKK